MHYPKGSGEEHMLLVLSLLWRNEHLELQMTCISNNLYFFQLNLSKKKKKFLLFLSSC